MIWAIEGSARLRPETKAMIENPDNDIVVSAASAWEATIKLSQGRLSIPDDLPGAIESSGFDALDVTVEHAVAAGALPRHHGDPFDRVLIAQAQLESLTIVTRDRRFAAYGVALLPA